MSDDTDGPKSIPSPPDESAPALALAMAAASRDKADAFLEEQIDLAREQKALIRLQAKELSHELDLRHWSLLVRHFSGLLRLTLEIGLAMAGLGLACFIAAAVWNAAHADGLVIESFSVPPDMAARGLTGQVIASKTLDELTRMANNTDTYRAAKSYANNWGNDIKVEIPETGVSVGEAYRFLKSWLGHETHISGEVTRTATGIAITARTVGSSGVTSSGSEADLDALILKAAEHIYGSTQPFRYASYLTSLGRSNEAIPIYQTMISTGSAQERPWGYAGLANLTPDATSTARTSLLERALALQPDNVLFLQILSAALAFQNRSEEALAIDRRSQAVFRSSGGGDVITANRLPAIRKTSEARIAMATGDFRKAARDQADSIALGALPRLQRLSNIKALAETGAHELAAARATTADPDYVTHFVSNSPGFPALADIAARMQMDTEAGDWATIRSRARTLDLLVAKYPVLRGSLSTMAAPLVAFARARLGDFAAAESTIAPTPGYCYLCLRTRARIAALQRRHARADWWFARAIQSAPSIPFAYSDWGQALLERGKPDDAIEKFTLANQKGPKFADPLEGWGEALMAKNQSHLALEKFAQAEKYAPNWGRLHLKWGEALIYAGKKDEAKAQFTRAAALDLTPSEKTELAQQGSKP